MAIKITLMLFICIIAFCSPRLAINELPMYGDTPKTPEMIGADKAFINMCKNQFASLELASEYMTNRGWYYLKWGEISVAMKRFNQAWLLDSTNAMSYWGMAIIVSVRDMNYQEASRLMDIAISYDSSICELWFDHALANLAIFEKQKDKTSCSKAINSFQKSIELKCDENRIKKANNYINRPKEYLCTVVNDTAYTDFHLGTDRSLNYSHINGPLKIRTPKILEDLDTSYSDIHFGSDLSLNYSFINGSLGNKFPNGPGISFGIEGYYKRFGLNIDLGVNSIRNYKTNFYIGNNQWTDEFDYSFDHYDLNLCFILAQNKKTNIHLLAGYGFGRLYGDIKDRNKYDGNDASEHISTGIKPSYLISTKIYFNPFLGFKYEESGYRIIIKPYYRFLNYDQISEGFSGNVFGINLSLIGFYF